MVDSESTCWTMIRGAASGRAGDRSLFAHRYLHLVRAYLQARWARTRHVGEVDDAAQEVFVECFRQEGVLQAVAQRPVGSFRAFLKGVVRNIALRHEGRKQLVQTATDRPTEPCNDETASRAFDRAWARQLLGEAATAFEARAAELGPQAQRRVKLLRLRFEDGLPIRDIAAQWHVDAAMLHHEYARARREFRAAIEAALAQQQESVTEADFDELMRLVAAPTGG